MKTLPDNFYSMPDIASTTIDSKELKELLLATGGNVLSCGKSWDIITKHMGVGVYKITLNRKIRK